MVKNKMNKVISKDGTEIAFDKQGVGPGVILVDGALSFRSFGPMPELAKLLSTNFTVIDYDRRGRGESSESKPFAVEREIEDIEALMNEVGGFVYLYGVSSGACLAIEASIKLGWKVKKLALYEAPYKSGENALEEWSEYKKQLTKSLEENRRGDAVDLFMRFVGTPADQIAGMRQSSMWQMLEAVAPTLLYDAAVMGADRKVPIERVSYIVAPTLVMHGGEGLPFMKQTALTLSRAIPNAKFRTIENQTHAVASEAVAPVLAEFFKS
jgi:pimeloyl-ACP methyl ester carboxylesterase